MSFDPETFEVTEVFDIDGAEMRGVTDTTVADGKLILAGSAPGSLGSIDLGTGEVETRGRFGDVGVQVETVVTGPDDSLFVLGSTGEPLFGGVVYRIDPESLQVLAETSLPAQQGLAAGTVMPDGTLLSLSESGPMGLTVIPPGEDPVVTPLKGGPQRIVLGPSGLPLVTLYSKNSVVEVDPAGSVKRRVPGLGTAPIGIDIGPDGIGVVASEGDPDVPGAVHFADFDRMRLIDSVPVEDCEAPREVVIVDERAFVGCLGPPSLLVYDLSAREQIGFTSLWPWTDKEMTLPFGDEPRGFTLVPS